MKLRNNLSQRCVEASCVALMHVYCQITMQKSWRNLVSCWTIFYLPYDSKAAQKNKNRTLMPGSPGAFSPSVCDFLKHTSEVPEIVIWEILKAECHLFVCKKALKRRRKKEKATSLSQKLKSWPETSSHLSPSLPHFLSRTVVKVQ